MEPKFSLIEEQLRESGRLKLAMAESTVESIQKAVESVVRALQSGGKVLLCGNGGSAADSQHIASELVGRFRLNRGGIPAIALTTDTSILTAVGNDYGFEDVFRRQVEALGEKGDVLIGMSTSGKSRNVVLAMDLAREMGMVVIAFVGGDGGPVVDAADVVVQVPSTVTPRIQEGHITVGHILCDLVERFLFDKGEGE
jgi:D-sedoheptulose 7-phosphate isomerase